VTEIMLKHQVIKYRGVEKSLAQELVVYESPLTIFFNGQELVTLLCSPDKLDALALGFLRTEGLIKEISEVSSLKLEEEKGLVEIKTFQQGTLSEKLYSKRLVPTGCGSYGKGELFYNIIDSIKCKPVQGNLVLKPEQIYSFVEEILQESKTYELTGGVHTASLFDNRGSLICCEDVARHNAVDKVIGQSLLQKISLVDKVMVVSGRVSSEMLLKTAKLEIPFLISKSAPTHLSVKMAKELNVTLVGFVRGRRMNIYANDYRVIASSRAD